jgi:hypothetical protein
MFFKLNFSGLILFCILIIAPKVNAQNLSISLESVDSKYKDKLEKTFLEIEKRLPTTFIKDLPKNIKIKIEKMSGSDSIPQNICLSEEKDETKNKFVYGEYNKVTNTLKINLAVMNEIIKGESGSKKINCQHKNLYMQSIATLIHEISHAYDFNLNNLSSHYDFLRIAGFKKGLLKIKNKNTKTKRSVDPYELTNVAEAFAVNFEYFILDSEYACRRPSMFNYYKNLFNFDPFPNRSCELNKNVMLSSSTGMIPVELKSNRVYRIDYLMASKGNDISSGFGHSMFRLVVCAPERIDPITGMKIAATPFGKKCLDDKLFHLVVSYRANVEDATLNYMKGLFGGYQSMLFILSLNDVMEEYNRDELRDLVAYPLKLTNEEINDVVTKIIEEHWNYRGSYKFITNNCATESLDLLKASIGSEKLNKNFSLTPNGLLEDLDKLEFLDQRSLEIETYPAKTEHLLSSYKIAYDYKSKNNKEDLKVFKKFVDESLFINRRNKYQTFLAQKIINENDHEELFELKKRLVKSSSFSIVEQQVLRSTGAKFRKKAAEIYTNMKDEETKKKLDQLANGLKSNLSLIVSGGYGVPLVNEFMSRDDLIAKIEANTESAKNLEDLFRKLMAEEYNQLLEISNNISEMNEGSIQLRKLYKEKLEKYIMHVLENMRNTTEDQTILLGVQNGNKADVLRLRKRLDIDLVTEKEILDVKLQKMVDSILN